MSSRGSNALHQSRAQEVGIRRPRLQGQKPELHPHRHGEASDRGNVLPRPDRIARLSRRERESASRLCHHRRRRRQRGRVHLETGGRSGLRDPARKHDSPAAARHGKRNARRRFI